jgi:hypothetical protein
MGNPARFVNTGAGAMDDETTGSTSLASCPATATATATAE